jgi:hypothetical protein
MGDQPEDRLVISYLGEAHYHRSMPEDELRPACRPTRMRGVLSMRVRAERAGQIPCPECWPES